MLDEKLPLHHLPLALSRPRKYRRIIGFVVLCVLVGTFLHVTFLRRTAQTIRVIPDEAISIAPKPITKAFVVASTQKEDTSWFGEYLADWELKRYVVDNETAEYTVPKNKGREAMVYLTYIIDHYDKLPDISVFLHSQRYQWHNDDPLYDGVPMLQSLQIPYLLQNNYTNLRCVWTLGCPAELNLDTTPLPVSENLTKTEAQPPPSTQIYFPAAFAVLFPSDPLPPKIGVPCCAQFAVTRSTILSRPLSSYIHYRKWLTETELDDQVSGRVLEYSWHIIFGKEPVSCMDVEKCYCALYGICGLETCNSEKGSCGERWPFPPSATLPSGWPGRGWEQEERGEDELRGIREKEGVRRVEVVNSDEKM